MLRERPVARLSAAIEGTKLKSSAAAETFSLVLGETEPRPDKALEAVDFDTPASFATSASVFIPIAYVPTTVSEKRFGGHTAEVIQLTASRAEVRLLLSTMRTLDASSPIVVAKTLDDKTSKGDSGDSRL